MAAIGIYNIHTVSVLCICCCCNNTNYPLPGSIKCILFYSILWKCLRSSLSQPASSEMLILSSQRIIWQCIWIISKYIHSSNNSTAEMLPSLVPFALNIARVQCWSPKDASRFTSSWVIVGHTAGWPECLKIWQKWKSITLGDGLETSSHISQQTLRLISTPKAF